MEVRYNSLEEDGDMVEGIVSAVDELALESEGDIQVFLSGERGIRESAEALRKLNTQSHVFEKYQAYVAQGIDEELKQFYDKGNIVPYLRK